MGKRVGLLERGELAQLAAAGEIDTVLAVFPDLYGRLMGKRFEAEYFVSQIVEAGTHACDYLLTVDMEMEPVPGYDFANWQKGYGDFHLAPDLGTLRRASWLDRTAVVLCDVKSEVTHEFVPVAPRSILRKQLDAAAQRGFGVMAASELEYYLFRDSYRDAAAKEYAQLEPAGWYLEDYHALQGTREEEYNGTVRRHLKQSGIAVECTKGEWGTGQHELNVHYTDMLAMADNHVVFKQCCKELAEGMGVSVTFMAKFSDKQAGSSCHVHLSLWQGGKNAFAGSQKLGRVECSDVFLKFLAGWMAHAPEVMPFYAPNVNSYKRFQSGSWRRRGWPGATIIARPVFASSAKAKACGSNAAFRGPTAIRTWSSRQPSLRVSTGSPRTSSRRLNSAATPITRANCRTSPRRWPRPRAYFEQSDFVRRTFGDDVTKHYVHFFQTEQAAYDRAVTDWERSRYFERI